MGRAIPERARQRIIKEKHNKSPEHSHAMLRTFHLPKAILHGKTYRFTMSPITNKPADHSTYSTNFLSPIHQLSTKNYTLIIHKTSPTLIIYF